MKLVRCLLVVVLGVRRREPGAEQRDPRLLLGLVHCVAHTNSQLLERLVARLRKLHLACRALLESIRWLGLVGRPKVVACRTSDRLSPAAL